MADLLRNIRTQVLIKLITPYTRIHIPFISKELNIDACEVESLLVSCILDRSVQSSECSGYIQIFTRDFNAFCPNCICILIVYSTIRGRIDQVNQVLELDKQSVCAARYNALDKWTSQLATLHLAVVNKMA